MYRNRNAMMILAAAFFSITAACGSVCDNAPCEEAINATVGENFTISLPYNAGTGYQWWTNFDPEYISLVDCSETAEESSSEMMGSSEETAFTFSARKSGSTEAIMLLLRPWENGTVEERRIFPVNIA
ncbi:MAG TPA: protease inhibitor I42 family protein [Methanothrix sp.]|nr:protease inhibitor I42 family protein [Methanothrix sp.]